jgi:hypothetical protein
MKESGRMQAPESQNRAPPAEQKDDFLIISKA